MAEEVSAHFLGMDGPAAGQQFFVKDGQILKVGRGDDVEFSIPGDLRMSGKHFAIKFKDGVCKIKDLGSRNGTQLNGKPIAEEVVQPGDKIQAGDSIFVLKLSKGSKEPAPKPGPAVAPPAKKPSGPAVYHKEPCNSGLFMFWCEGDAPAPVAVADKLAKLCPLYVVSHPFEPDLFAKQPDSDNCLFDWLPEPAKSSRSPRFFAMGGPMNCKELIAQGWGQNAIVCFFSRMDKQKLFDHIKLVCKGVNKEGKAPEKDSVFAFCWPKTISAILKEGDADSVRYFMTGIDAVFVESEEPGPWIALSGSGFGGALESIGIQPAE